MLWFVAFSVQIQWRVQLIYTQTKQECLMTTQNIVFQITEIMTAVYEGSFILRDQTLCSVLKLENIGGRIEISLVIFQTAWRTI